MANKTGVYPVYENQFKIDKTGGTGATAENLVTIADMESFSVMPKYSSRETPSTLQIGPAVVMVGALESAEKYFFTVDSGKSL